MATWELALVAIGLSMDAFAVALCKGMNMRRFDARHAAIIALFFGGFQAAMPAAGWLLGLAFRGYVEAYDHWLAFALLLGVGGKMIVDFFRSDGCPVEPPGAPDLRQLTALAVSTSIDAFAVGISFAALKVPIAPAGALIGATTFALSFAGVAAGRLLGVWLRNKAELLGGITLVGIGVKILLEGVGLL